MYVEFRASGETAKDFVRGVNQLVQAEGRGNSLVIDVLLDVGEPYVVLAHSDGCYKFMLCFGKGRVLQECMT
jgi:hypothetical protein